MRPVLTLLAATLIAAPACADETTAPKPERKICRQAPSPTGSNFWLPQLGHSPRSFDTAAGSAACVAGAARACAVSGNRVAAAAAIACFSAIAASSNRASKMYQAMHAMMKIGCDSAMPRIAMPPLCA